MQYFANVDENNQVVDILVGSKEFIEENFPGTWIEAKLDGSIRYNYAGIGYTYDPDRDAFIPPQPPLKPDWVLNQETLKWEEPA